MHRSAVLALREASAWQDVMALIQSYPHIPLVPRTRCATDATHHATAVSQQCHCHSAHLTSYPICPLSTVHHPLPSTTPRPPLPPGSTRSASHTTLRSSAGSALSNPTSPRCCRRFYAQGARFAKWRAVYTIDPASGLPSEVAVRLANERLALYALICQQAGLVPIVEPEVLADGSHGIEVCAAVTQRVGGAGVKR